MNSEQVYLYDVKDKYITETEEKYLKAIEKLLPDGYILYPQIPLSSVIARTDNSRFQNELFRIIDAGVFNKETYKPIFLIEINDQTHKESSRAQRDKKVKMICEEAGLPLVTLWTNYGIKPDYISKRINEAIEQSKNPVRKAYPHDKKPEKKQGCYIATCIYGSYNCPQVWTLRRYRDNKLAKTLAGRLFIKMYYTVSPGLVVLFGNKRWFVKPWKFFLDRMIDRLNKSGYHNTPYNDK